MEIRPEMLERLLSESDERLWEIIRRVGAMNGVTLPKAPPPGADMARLRALMSNGSMNYEEALALLSRYKGGQKP